MTDFVKGARVRLSEYGRESHGWGEKLHHREGTARARRFSDGLVTVMWDGRKSPERVWEGYLELVQ